MTDGSIRYLILYRIFIIIVKLTSLSTSFRGLVQSPCGKINVIMTLGGGGGGGGGLGP